MTRLALLIATTGGVGYSPVAPGTVGAMAGVLWHLGTRSWDPVWQCAALAALLAASVWAADVAARHAGRKDPGHVVIDEVVGQALTLLLLSPASLGLLAGFILFRVFDIAKPWPVRRFEALPGGLGIVADDVMAGIYGWLCLKALLAWQPGLS